MAIKRHILKVLAIVLPVFLIGYFLESFRQVSSMLGDYFEITTELLPLVMSFSIFVITWYAYSKSRDNHSLFLGAAFFIVGLLDLYHMLSYPFMPAFITPNSQEKALIFESESMLAGAILVLASVYIYKNTSSGMINKSILLASIIVISSISLASSLFFPEFLPVLLDPDGSPSSTMVLAQIVTVAILIYAGYLYTVRLQKTGQNNIICLIYSFSIFVTSDIVYVSHGYAGHLLKAAGFYFVYLALYKSSVEEPFVEETRAESKMRMAAEERYRNLVDNANDAIITIDIDGRITSWNRSAERIFGWGMDEVTGNKLSQLIVPPEIQAEHEQIIHNTMSGDAVSGIETVHLRRDGNRINVNLTISPLRDTEQNIIGLSCIVRDITERVQAEEISMENMRLELAIKAKSVFLTDMSHDLGTPLNAIIGFSELLKHRIPGELNQKQELYVANIITSAVRMLDIINDILDLGMAETGRIELVIENISVPDIINETTNLAKQKFAKYNVVLKREFDPALEFIEADRQRFRQILFNLVSNAVKFSKPEGGTITIATKKEGDMARISVMDKGIGIKDEDMGRLFNPFHQLNLGIASKYGSTGLGLVVTKKLVEHHGGKIMVKSKFGEGSTFTVLLPLISKKAAKNNNY